MTTLEVESAVLLLRNGSDTIMFQIKATTPTPKREEDNNKASVSISVATGHGHEWLKLNYPDLVYTTLNISEGTR